MSKPSLSPPFSSSARITFKGLWRSWKGLLGLALFLIAWLTLGFLGPWLFLSEPVAGQILITQHGFRATGAIIEFDPARYENPGSTSISAGDTVLFKNSSDHTIKLCLEQRGECSEEAQGPTSLRFPGLTLAPGQSTKVAFPDAGDYPLTLQGFSFAYNRLTIHVK